MRLPHILSCFYMLLTYVNAANVRVDPLVLTTQGLVRGDRATDGDYSTFLGIPYAQVDPDNPFGESLPYPHFEEVYNADDDTSKCPQRNRDGDVTGDLDCLRLNIYVPLNATSRNTLPVLFWIHGGGFRGGYGGMTMARNIVKHDVILVTINYRLGPYGFLCLDIPNVPGNQGLKDQHTALQWIKDNIAAFGGDVNSITIAGQSAGAGSVELHLYSPHEKLFHKAILHSGSAKVERMFMNGDYSAAIQISQFLGFFTTDTEVAVRFLSTVAPQLVVSAAWELNLWFRPCKELEFDNVINFVVQDSQNLYNLEKITNTPILIGFTTSEEYDPTLSYEDDVTVDDIFLNKIETHFDFDDEEELIRISKVVRRFYTGDDEIPNNLVSALSDFESDFTFNHPIDRTIVKYIEQGAKVYQFVFAYTEDDSVASHGVDLKYIFPMQDQEISSETGLLVADRMSSMWSNFVKQGTPIPEETVLLPVTWEPASIDNRHYLLIDADLTEEQRIYSQRMAFWDLFYDHYGIRNVLNTERPL